MKSRLGVLFLAIVLTCFAAIPSAAAPDAGPCLAGGGYDPACDTNHDGVVNVLDVQLTAGHWNQTGTYTGDNDHNHLGQTWIGTGSPLVFDGIWGTPYYAPLILNNSGGSGLQVGSAALSGVAVEVAGGDGLFVCRTGSAGACNPDSTNNGIEVGNAQNQGVRIGHSGGTGVYVGSAGNPSTTSTTAATYNGFQVDGTQGNGLYIGRADLNGVVVESAAGSGFYVGSATGGLYVGNTTASGVTVHTTNFNGVAVDTAGTNGFYVGSAVNNGLYVGSAINGVYVNSASNYAGNFNGNIYVSGNCVGCLITQLAVNASNEVLLPGDIVEARGIAASKFDGLLMLIEIRRASTGKALLGVVTGRAEEYKDPETGSLILVSRNGEPAVAGEYVSIAIYGPQRVTSAGEVELGDKVTIANESGTVRALSHFQLQRIDGGYAELPEEAPVLGIALEDAVDGKVWVLVNPQ